MSSAAGAEAHLLTQLHYYRGRVGLHAILKALGVGRDDEVAIQAFTCVAVPEAIMALRARCRFVDIERHGVNMDPDDLQRKLTGKTCAIVVQHTFGIPARLDAIFRIADERGLPVIGDCCHALVSRFGGKNVRDFGVASFFSYEWGKPIVAGIGGSVLANDPSLRRRLEHAHACLRDPPSARELKTSLQYVGFKNLYSPATYWMARSVFRALSRTGVFVGSFNELDNGNGVASPEFGWKMGRGRLRLVRNGLRRIEYLALRARAIAAAYDRLIDSPSLERPLRPEGSEAILARYPIFVDDKEALLARAHEAGVEAAPWYATPVHPLEQRHWGSVGYDYESCPNAERNSRRVISLPIGPTVTRTSIERAAALLGAR